MSVDLLEKDKAYLVFVEKIEPKTKRPSFEVGGVTKYNFMIDIKTREEKKYRVEYASPTQLPDEIVHGAWQWIKCIKPSEFGCEIVPCDEPGKQQPKGNSLPQPASDTTKPEERMNVPPVPQQSFVPNKAQSDRGLSVCMSYAKDLKVAQIAKRKAGAPVTEDDIAEVIAWGIKLYDGMEEKLTF